MMIAQAAGGTEEEAEIHKTLKYYVYSIQYLQGVEKIPKGIHRNVRTTFLHITKEALEFRVVPRPEVSQLIQQDSFTYESACALSTLEDIIYFEEIERLDQKSTVFKNGPNHLVGLYVKRENNDKNKPAIVFRLPSEAIMNECYEEISNQLLRERTYVEKQATNFLGVEENVRKIIDKILLACPDKREVYNRTTRKLSERRIKLPPNKNKLMLYALMGNHPEMQNLLRKEKIEAYDIEKRKEQERLRQDSNATDLVEPVLQLVEGYSEKRKMDGIILRREQYRDAKDSTVAAKLQEELYIDSVPYREEFQLDELIGIHGRVEAMQLEEKISMEEPISYNYSKARIPTKDYSLIGKEIEFVKNSQAIGSEVFDLGCRTAVEAVKFMYQLMRAVGREACEGKEEKQILNEVLDCLKDVITECEYKQEERKSELKHLENKTVVELIQKASKNYTLYRRDPTRFY